MNFDYGASSIQSAVRRQSLVPLVAFRPWVNLGKIRRDTMSIAHIYAGANVHRDVGCDVDRDVARSGLQIGIQAFAAGITSFTVIPPALVSARAEGPVKLDTATARLCVNVSLG